MNSIFPQINDDISFHLATHHLDTAQLLALRSVSHQTKKFMDRSDIWDSIADDIGLYNPLNSGILYKSGEINSFDLIEKIYKIYFKLNTPDYTCITEKVSFRKFSCKREKKWRKVMEKSNLALLKIFIEDDFNLSKEHFIYYIEKNNYDTTSLTSTVFHQNIVNLSNLKILNIYEDDSKQFKKPGSLKFIPNDICKLNQLHTLSINECIFISNEIGKLINLVDLRIHKSNLKTVHLVKNLTNLEILSLAENTIEEIPSFPKLNKLKILNLRNNCIKKIEGLFSLKNLEQIILTENDLTEFPQDILKLKKLESLVFDTKMKITSNEISFMRKNEVILINNSGITFEEGTPRYFFKQKGKIYKLLSEAINNKDFTTYTRVLNNLRVRKKELSEPNIKARKKRKIDELEVSHARDNIPNHEMNSGVLNVQNVFKDFNPTQEQIQRSLKHPNLPQYPQVNLPKQFQGMQNFQEQMQRPQHFQYQVMPQYPQVQNLPIFPLQGIQNFQGQMQRTQQFQYQDMPQVPKPPSLPVERIRMIEEEFQEELRRQNFQNLYMPNVQNLPILPLQREVRNIQEGEQMPNSQIRQNLNFPTSNQFLGFMPQEQPPKKDEEKSQDKSV
ncbi:MAG: leucine-rich repeat domain-containing protein [Candidatus Protochlamydia sp.]|nr:leucine-rich repeat domain-containing protein [Candidatus Protochlamydia sp.]